MKTKVLHTVILAMGISAAANAQTPYVLLGHSYSQDFSTLATGLPGGWQVYKNATTSSLGSAANYNMAATPWVSGAGSFNNNAAMDTFYANAPAASQNAAANRALGIKQDATLDGGAAFVFRISNTRGLSCIHFSFNLASLDLNAVRRTTWRVDYAKGSNPTSFNAIMASGDLQTGDNSFKQNTITGALPWCVNNQDSNIWIRIVALDPATGSLTWPTSTIDNFSLTWNGKPPITMQSNRTNVPCYGGQTGAYNLVVGGAAPPYEYAVDSAAPNAPVFTNNPSFTALYSGIHTIMVRDADSSVYYFTDTITQPDAPLGMCLKKIDAVTCYGGSDGIASANAWGGTPPYQYSWDGNPYGAFKTDKDTNGTLTGGLHVVTIKDTNGCLIADNKFIWQPDSISATFYISDVSCPGGGNGYAYTEDVSGGNHGCYHYQWSTNAGDSSSEVDNLAAGTYTLTITDRKGCSNSFPVTIAQPDPFVINKNITPDMGNCSGSVTVTVNGATPGYSYYWSTGSTAQTISDLCYNQIYFLKVEDSRGCYIMDTITVPLPTDVAEASGNNAVKLYPNPASDVLNIDAPQNVNIIISDVSGKTLRTVENAKQVNVSDMSTGIYIISILDEKNQLIGHSKFMKQ